MKYGEKHRMGNIMLSICIPTYNRANYLKEVLDSIFCQIDINIKNKIEIVISDNASTDNTEEIVKEFQKRNIIPVNYAKNPQNIGFDRNCMNVVKLARGEYCWLFGDDDRFSTNALNIVISEIVNFPEVDVFLCNRTEYDKDFRSIKSFIPELTIPKNTSFDFKTTAPLEYLTKVNNVAGLFGFISVLIFKKNKWQSIKVTDWHLNTNYIHIFMIMAILWGKNKSVLRYITKRLVDMRVGNDRYVSLFNRFQLEIEYIHIFAVSVLGENKTLREIDAILLKSGGFTWIINMKLYGGLDFYCKAIPIIFKYYWRDPAFWIKIFPLMLLPGFIIRIIRFFYRKIIKPIIIIRKRG